jgi:quinolinate synthase
MKADHVLSTGGIYRRCKQSSSKTFIIGIEINMVERLRREIPGKMFSSKRKCTMYWNEKNQFKKHLFSALKRRTGSEVIQGSYEKSLHPY